MHYPLPAVGYELYDLNQDPYEVHNIYPQASQVGGLAQAALAPSVVLGPLCNPSRPLARTARASLPCKTPPAAASALGRPAATGLHVLPPVPQPLSQRLTDYLKAALNALKICKGSGCLLTNITALAEALRPAPQPTPQWPFV